MLATQHRLEDLRQQSGQVTVEDPEEAGHTPFLLPVDSRIDPDEFEGIIQSKVRQFTGVFVKLLGFSPTDKRVKQAEEEAWKLIPRMAHAHLNLERSGVQLTFRHECKNLGCEDDQCVLCMNNPKRRCRTNFGKGYVEEDLRAKCNAPIRVEVIDKATGHKIPQDILDVMLEFFVIEGDKYDRIVELERRPVTEDELDAMAILSTRIDSKRQKEPQQLLTSGDPTVDPSTDLKVRVPLKKSELQLPALRLMAGSEATMSGKAPPFRLVARAVSIDGSYVNIETVISEPFVVASARARSDAKVEHPNLDTPVGKLPFVGPETVRKLADIEKVASEKGLRVPGIPPHLNKVTKVGELKELIKVANQLQQSELSANLPKVLGVSKDCWPAVKELALKAIQPDMRPRAFFPPRAPTKGLIFGVRDGQVDISQPSALLANVTGYGIFRLPLRMLTREDRSLLQFEAERSWWTVGHEGWNVLEGLPPTAPLGGGPDCEGQGESAAVLDSRIAAHNYPRPEIQNTQSLARVAETEASEYAVQDRQAAPRQAFLPEASPGGEPLAMPFLPKASAGGEPLTTPFQPPGHAPLRWNSLQAPAASEGSAGMAPLANACLPIIPGASADLAQRGGPRGAQKTARAEPQEEAWSQAKRRRSFGPASRSMAEDARDPNVLPLVGSNDSVTTTKPSYPGHILYTTPATSEGAPNQVSNADKSAWTGALNPRAETLQAAQGGFLRANSQIGELADQMPALPLNTTRYHSRPAGGSIVETGQPFLEATPSQPSNELPEQLPYESAKPPREQSGNIYIREASPKQLRDHAAAREQAETDAGSRRTGFVSRGHKPQHRATAGKSDGPGAWTHGDIKAVAAASAAFDQPELPKWRPALSASGDL